MTEAFTARMAQRIELWPVERLQPYDRNARTHSDAQVAKIAASMTEFGFTNPVLVDSADGIIAGHGRLMAAKRLGLAEVPVVVLDYLTDAQRRAYILADNRLALDAGWDEEMLAAELAALQIDGFDLDLTGFNESEIDRLLVAEDDAVAEMPVLPSGEKNPFQQKTFTLHDEQADVVDDAITLARTSPLADTGLNENSNGNALALICRQWLEVHNAQC